MTELQIPPEEIIKRIAPEVESIAIYVVKRLRVVSELVSSPLKSYRDAGHSLFDKLYSDLIDLLQNSKIPSLSKEDIKNLNPDEIENRRITRAYLLSAVAGNFYLLADKAKSISGEGYFTNHLEKIALSIQGNPTLMFSDLIKDGPSYLRLE